MKRICLLTGASGLLGTAFIERYAEKYQIVAVHNRKAIQFATQEQVFIDPLTPTRELPANRKQVYSVRADISEQDQIDSLISQVSSRFGGVDLLINAAVVYAWSHLAEPGALDHAEELIRVNVLTPLRLAVGLARRLWRLDLDANLRLNRNIVNISSVSGSVVHADLGLGLYAMSKAALNHLTYYLANDFWDIGIRVNALAPSSFPAHISTDDVVEAIVELDASDQTGHVIPLNNRAHGARDVRSRANRGQVN